MEDSLKKAREVINKVDMEMAALFEERMSAAKVIAEYKAAHGLEILDSMREAEVIRRGVEAIVNPELKEYYVSFLKNTMAVSRAYQSRLCEGMRVAYSGTEGAFAHIASARIFPTAKKIAYNDFAFGYQFTGFVCYVYTDGYITEGVI